MNDPQDDFEAALYESRPLEPYEKRYWAALGAGVLGAVESARLLLEIKKSNPNRKKILTKAALTGFYAVVATTALVQGFNLEERIVGEEYEQKVARAKQLAQP